MAKWIFNYIHAILETIAHLFFKIYYGWRRQQVPSIKDPILLDSVTTIAYKIRTKKITSVEVLNSFINRIKEINPLLNCVVADRFLDALKEAQTVDNLIKSNTTSETYLAENKPFLGVPFTSKDATAVKGMIQSAGLYKRRDFKAPEDADAIANLRNAGAIPIALTNIPEMLMWWESSNAIHGRTSNPYDINRTSGGSSGGEGALQATAGSAFGTGTDIGGSVRIPAMFNGIFGHKPSECIVSNAGNFPKLTTDIQSNMFTVGPMCRHAEDLIPIFKVMVKKEVRNTLKLDEKVDLKKIKYYYQKTNMGEPFVTPVQGEIKELFTKVVSHFDTALNIKAEEVRIETFCNSGAILFADMSFRNAPNFEKQLSNLEGNINVTVEMLKWCIGMSKHTLPALFTVIMERGDTEQENPQSNYISEQKKLLSKEMKALLGNDGVFIYPTHPTAAPYHNEAKFKPLNLTYTAIINSLGFPATHCPMGLNSEGLPIGLQVISNINNDRLCLAVAMELEKAFGGWVYTANYIARE